MIIGHRGTDASLLNHNSTGPRCTCTFGHTSLRYNIARCEPSASLMRLLVPGCRLHVVPPQDMFPPRTPYAGTYSGIQIFQQPLWLMYQCLISDRYMLFVQMCESNDNSVHPRRWIYDLVKIIVMFGAVCNGIHSLSPFLNSRCTNYLSKSNSMFRCC